MTLARLKGIENVQQLSKYFGYKSPEKLYRLERDKENAKPSFAILNDISNKFENADLNYLVSGIKKEYKIEVREDNVINEEFAPKLITVDKHGNENIVFVPTKAQANYLSGFNDETFIKKLPIYSLPKLNDGNFRMFEVNNTSMFPTLHKGSIVVGEYEKSFKNIEENHIYIIVTNENILIKRALQASNQIVLRSDNNQEYPSSIIEAKQIKELWKLKSVISFEFHDPTNLNHRVNALETSILELSEKIK